MVQLAKTYTLTVGNFGLDLRNVKSQLQDTFLISAKNVVCRQGFIENRKHVVKLIASESAIRMLYYFTEYDLIVACTDNKIIVLNRLNQVVVEKSGYSSGNWSIAYFNHRLFLANGLDVAQTIYSDAPESFVIEDVSITGPSSLTFSFVGVANNQLCFGVNSSLSFYFLPVGNVSGAASLFDLSTAIGSTRKGGSLVAIHNLPRDSGMGMQDYVCMFTDQGEVVVYKGNDFSDPTNFEFCGLYQTYPFAGKNFITKYGNDLLLITTNGIMTMSDVISTSLSQSTGAIFSSPINQQFTTYNYALRGFMGCVVPQEDFILFNIPREGGKSIQWVMDLATHRWSSFVDIDANCMLNAHNDTRLLFGLNDGIYEYTNDGVPATDYVVTEVKTSYTPMSNFNNKQFNLFNARLQSTAPLNVSYTIHKNIDDASYYEFISDNGIAVSEVTNNGYFEIGNPAIDTPHSNELFYWEINDETVDPLHEDHFAFWEIGTRGSYSEDSKWHSGSGLSRNFALTLQTKTNRISYRLYDIIFKYTEAIGTI